ncbi:MAG: polyprenyl synthetase family protein [Bacteroidota bacterium]
MFSIDELHLKVSDALAKQNLTLCPYELYEPISYTLDLGGKRIRPVMVLLACNLFTDEISHALPPAMAIEFFHNFTLIHDDIMDDAPIRRNKPTVYKKWNANTAILSGDTMFAKAYELLCETDKEYLYKILGTFTRTAIEVCEGQQFDMNFEKEESVPIDEYLNMIRLKTAVLLAASMNVGACMGNASDEDVKNLYSFGINIGMAFQLQDDLLDVYADQEKFGKQLGNDIVTNKKTYLLLKAFELCNDSQKDRLRALLKLNEQTEIKVDGVKALYYELDIHKVTTNEIDIYFDKALADLDKVKVENSRKQELLKFVSFLVKRDY